MTRETRLRFHLRSQGALWYHVQASTSHVLIDPQVKARALAPGFVRPIELWRAPRWQRPSSVNMFRDNENHNSNSSNNLADHGNSGNQNEPENHHNGANQNHLAKQNQAANHNDTEAGPAFGPAVNLSSVVDFVSDVRSFPLGAFGALIDAVAAALDGGPPVVLAAPNPDQGALWIGAVSFFAPAQTCLRLSFSTHEQLADVLALVAKDSAGESDPVEAPNARFNGATNDESWHCPVLTVVPQSDVDRLTRRDDLSVVVIDPRVEPTLGSVEGVQYRRTQLGQQIKVTDWSRLALDICCENYQVLEQCLRRLDDVGLTDSSNGSVRPEPDPAWSLAVAIVLTGGLALPMATRVLRRTDADRLATLMPGAVDATEQAWQRLGSVLDAEPVQAGEVQQAFADYLHSALDDDSWLLRAAPPLPAAPPRPVDPGLPARLRGPLTRMVHRLTHGLPADGDPAGDVRCGVLMLRGIDFAHRIAWLVGGPDLTEVGIGRLADRAAEVLLDATAGVRVAEVVGPLDGTALARWLVPPLSRANEPWLTSGNPVGQRLPAPVIAFLAGAIDPARLIAATRTDPLVTEPVALEVAVASASGRIAGDPRLRGPAVEYLLHRADRAYPDADPGPMVADAFERVGDEPWPASALLRLVERAPPRFGADLVPIVLRQLPDWVDDPLSARLAATLLKRIEFLPRMGADRRARPRRAGTTDGQAQLLNLLAASGTGWLQLDDGLHRRAAEILMWGDRAWTGADPEIRRLIAPRITVAAFQVALAAEPAQAKTVLRARLGVIPVGSSWRSAVEIGLEPALGMLAQVLRLNRYRLAGELVIASTRAMLRPVEPLEPAPHPHPHSRDPHLPDSHLPDPMEVDRPRLSMLPVEPVIRWLVAHADGPELEEHLAALVKQEVRQHGEPPDWIELNDFWERALPGAFGPGGLGGDQPPEPILEEVLQVALGVRDAAGRPLRPSGLAGLLGLPARWSGDTRTEEGAPQARPRWWRRWLSRSTGRS